jgi:ABC-type dipeptide/oligopeptide/nickel transport system ATPase component
MIKVKNLFLKYRNSNFQIGPNLTMEIESGEFVGIVGESGCGKSTLAKILIGLINQSELENFGIDQLNGELNIATNEIDENINYLDTTYKNLINMRKKVQMIFQNPRSSLNLNMPVLDTLMESINLSKPNINKKEKLKLIYQILIDVDFIQSNIKYDDFLNLDRILLKNGKLSGGERRRVSIAKAMIMEPDIIIADEPLASLDASIKNEILNYFISYWKKRKESNNPVTFIIISHDMNVINSSCQRVIVMYGDHINKRGEIIEEFKAPFKFKLERNLNSHPYTKELIEAALYFKTKKEFNSSKEDQSLIVFREPNAGCSFGAICPEKTVECEQDMVLKEIESGHLSSCIKQYE